MYVSIERPDVPQGLAHIKTESGVASSWTVSI